MTCDHRECQDFDPTRETCLVETQLARLERITRQLREDALEYFWEEWDRKHPIDDVARWSVDDDGVAHRTPAHVTEFYDRWARELAASRLNHFIDCLWPDATTTEDNDLLRYRGACQLRDAILDDNQGGGVVRFSAS